MTFGGPTPKHRQQCLLTLEQAYGAVRCSAGSLIGNYRRACGKPRCTFIHPLRWQLCGMHQLPTQQFERLQTGIRPGLQAGMLQARKTVVLLWARGFLEALLGNAREIESCCKA